MFNYEKNQTKKCLIMKKIKLKNDLSLLHRLLSVVLVLQSSSSSAKPKKKKTRDIVDSCFIGEVEEERSRAERTNEEDTLFFGFFGAREAKASSVHRCER
jgi:hypothetical protein